MQPSSSRVGAARQPIALRKQAGDAKRDAVLRTAARAFHERGFHTTSLDDIAERLQVTKPTLYYYVENKNDLLFQCVRAGLEEVAGAVDRAVKTPGTVLNKLRAFMPDYVRIVLDDFGRCATHVGLDPLSEERRLELQQIERRLAIRLGQLVTQGIAEGSLAECDPKVCVSVFTGGLNSVARSYRPRAGVPLDAWAGQAMQMLLHGLTPRGAKVTGKEAR